MKNFFIGLTILSALMTSICFCSTSGLYAIDTEIYYRISNESTYLYKTQDTNQETGTKLFLLPKTYFVKQLDDPIDNVVFVEFDGIYGYVDTINLTRVYETPTTPYPQSTSLDIITVANAVIYAEPDTNSTYLGVIPYNTSNVKMYGNCIGTEALSGSGTLWYYCTYESAGQGKITGYIYNSVAKNVVYSPENTEVVSTEPIQNVNGDIIAPELQSMDSVLLIIGISIPAIILLYLLFRPERGRRKAKRTISHTPRRSITYNEQQKGNDEFDF